jgi:hypothetical protein
MPNIGAVKFCLASTQHEGESEQDFPALLVKQLPRSNVKQFSFPVPFENDFLDAVATFLFRVASHVEIAFWLFLSYSWTKPAD